MSSKEILNALYEIDPTKIGNKSIERMAANYPQGILDLIWEIYAPLVGKTSDDFDAKYTKKNLSKIVQEVKAKSEVTRKDKKKDRTAEQANKQDKRKANIAPAIAQSADTKLKVDEGEKTGPLAKRESKRSKKQTANIKNTMNEGLYEIVNGLKLESELPGKTDDEKDLLKNVIAVINKFINGVAVTTKEGAFIHKFFSGKDQVIDRRVFALLNNNNIHLQNFLFNDSYKSTPASYIDVKVKAGKIESSRYQFDKLHAAAITDGKPTWQNYEQFLQEEFQLNASSDITLQLKFNQVVNGLFGNDVSYTCDLRKQTNPAVLYLATCPQFVMTNLFTASADVIHDMLLKLKTIKVTIMIEFKYMDMSKNAEMEDRIEFEFIIASKPANIVTYAQIRDTLDRENRYILNKLQGHAVKSMNSSYRFDRLLRYTVSISKNVNVRGGAYLPYAGMLKHKTQSLLNIEPDPTYDKLNRGCFLYCLWGAYHAENINKHSRNRATYYINNDLAAPLNIGGFKLPFPLDPAEYKRFEDQNASSKVALQVFSFDYEIDSIISMYRSEHFQKEGYKSIAMIYMPLEGHPEEAKYRINEKRSDGHYILIRDYEKFFTGITNSHKQRAFPCRKCGTHLSYGEGARRKHEESCTGEKNAILAKLPQAGTKKSFKNFKNQQEVPLFCVFDLESYQPAIIDKSNNQIRKLARHVASSAALTIHRIDRPEVETFVFTGKDCLRELVFKINEVSKDFYDMITDKSKYRPLVISRDDEIKFQSDTNCHICHKGFTREELLCPKCASAFDDFEKAEHERLRKVKLVRCETCAEKTNTCAKCIKQVRVDYSKFKPCSQCADIKIDNLKVRDHCHVTGKFRGAAHNSCNLNFRMSRGFRVPVFAHNAEGYDNHLMLQELLKHEELKNLNVIARTGERYMDITTKYFSLRDSYKHLGSSLHTNVYNTLWIDPISCAHCKNVIDDPLSIVYEDEYFIGRFECQSCKPNPNLVVPIIEKRIPASHVYNTFRATTQSVTENGVVNNEKLALICMKGEYPYSYMNSESRFEETALPPIEAFRNDLAKGYINDESRGKCPIHCYERAQKVFSVFGCKTLRDYEVIYVKSDTTLLTDVLINYFAKNMAMDGLHPAWYLTTPSYSDDRHKLMNYKLKLAGANFFPKGKYDNWTADPYCAKFPLPAGLSVDEIINNPEPTLEHDEELYKIYENTNGGLTNATKFYSKANLPCMHDYDPALPNKSISYLDMNSMYAGTMTKFLPCSNGHLIEDEATIAEMSAEEYIINWPEESPVAGLYIIDAYTKPEFHDMFNDLPLICEKREVEYEELSDAQKKILFNFERVMDKEVTEEVATKRIKSGMKGNVKLVNTLGRVTQYPVHYRLLQFYIKMGCIQIEKVHKIIVYRQSPFLRNYMEYFSDLRKKAKNESDKALAKLFNNSLFGKQMENKRNRCNVVLIDSDNEENVDKILKKMNDPYYRGHKYLQSPVAEYEENGVEYCVQNGTIAITMNKKNCNLDVMMQTGQAILQLSKLDIYKFWYENLKKRYPGPQSKLLYQDTDSLIFEAETDDIFRDMREDNKKDGWKYDMSNCSGEYADKTYARVPLCMKSETGSDPIYEFIALGPKSYSVVTLGDRNNWKSKCKGNPMSHLHEEFRLSLFQSMYQNTRFTALRSYNHQMCTIEVEKRGLCPLTDKRHYIPDSYETLAHGHYRIANKEYPIVEAYENIEVLQSRAVCMSKLESHLDSQIHYYTANGDKIVKTDIKPETAPISSIVVEDSKPKPETAKLNFERLPIPVYNNKGEIAHAPLLKGENGIEDKIVSYLHQNKRVKREDITIMRIEKDTENAFFAAYLTDKLNQTPFHSAHEVIFGDRPQKLAFDIDYEVPFGKRAEEDEVEAEFRKAIAATFKEQFGLDADIVVMSSCGPKNKTTYKISFHILASTTHYVSSALQSKRFAELVKEKLPVYYKPLIDFGIYSSIHNLRVLGSYKALEIDAETKAEPIGHLRQTDPELFRELMKKRAEDLKTYGKYKPVNLDRVKRGYDNFRQSLITEVRGLTLLPDITAKKEQKENIVIESKKMQYALSILPEDPDHEARCVNGRYVNFTRLRTSFCRNCNREHEKDNTKYVEVTDDNRVMLGCTKSKRKILIGTIPEVIPDVNLTSKQLPVNLDAGMRAAQFKAEDILAAECDSDDEVLSESDSGSEREEETEFSAAQWYTRVRDMVMEISDKIELEDGEGIDEDRLEEEVEKILERKSKVYNLNKLKKLVVYKV